LTSTPLSFPAFRSLWAGSLLSWSSQWIQHAALGWAVYEITGSGTLLGAVMGARAIPMILLAPVSGVAADRYDRRRLMQASQGLAAAVSLAFGAALALDAVSVWMLFAFTMLMGASNVMDRPARFTTAFELVPREIAVKAVALNTIGFSMARVLGPMAAGFLIAAFGGAGTFLLQGVLYAASGVMVLLVVFPPRVARKEQRSPWTDMVEGLRFAVTNRRTRVLLAVGLLPFFLLIPVFGTLYPIYAKDEFAVGPAGLGLLLTAVGVGGTLGGFIANALGHAERQGRLQAAWVVVMAAAIVGVAFSSSFAAAIVFSVIGGAAEMAHASSNMAMLQTSAPEEMRGRISSLLMLNPAFISLGALVAGPLSDAVGVRQASVILAAAAFAAISLLYAGSSSLRELRHK
jgi:MFS transporter, DHA1 family, staphyloferrin A biosynthesis exporter